MKKFFTKTTTMLLIGIMCVGICPVMTFASTSQEQASELMNLVYGQSGNEMAEDEEFMESVMQSPGHLSLDVSDAEIGEGETASINVKLTDAGWTSGSVSLSADKFEWTSDSPAATVNSSGVVTGQGEGTATITAKNASTGLSAATSVTVHAAAKEPDEDIMVMSEKDTQAEAESNVVAETEADLNSNTDINTDTSKDIVADANTDTVADANTDAVADANAEAAPEMTNEEEAAAEQAKEDTGFSFGLVSRTGDEQQAVNPDETDPAEGEKDPDVEEYAVNGEEADGEETDEEGAANVTPQLQMDPDSVTLQAGDAYTLSPSMLWYSSEYPEGQTVEFTFDESAMSYSGYLITTDEEEVTLSSEEIAALITCSYTDATTLEITTGTLEDGYVGAVITINLITTGNTAWDESDPNGGWTLTTLFQVILNQNNTGEEGAVPLADGDGSGDDAEGTGDIMIAIGNGNQTDSSTTTGDINSGNDIVINNNTTTNNTTNNNNSTNIGTVNWVHENVRFSDGNIRFVDHGRHHGPVRRFREKHGKPAPTPTSSNTTKSTVNPKTGDTSSSLTLAYTLLVSGACAGIAGLLIYRRRRA